MIGLGVKVYFMYVGKIILNKVKGWKLMLEFINNVRGSNRTVPESFRTICYCLFEL